MNDRIEFEMTEEDLAALLAACKPTPVMFLSGGTPMCASPQENANRAWARLGEKLGFETMSVVPDPANRQRFFLARPTGKKNAPA